MVKTRRIIIGEEKIVNKIYLIRGMKVMLDFDLSELYAVETKQLKRQVKRNLDRFPKDFMFELKRTEYNSLRSQFGTLKRGEHSKYMPMAFTEQGVAMLSSVLNSKTAIGVNIKIIRVFNRMREVMSKRKDILLKLEQLETKIAAQDGKIVKHEFEIYAIFEALKKLINPILPKKPRIGFRRSSEND